IALSRIATTNFTTDPRTSDLVVDGNLVTAVPLWHSFATHSGARISFSNNTSGACPRAFFITVDGIGTHPQSITLTGNRLQTGSQVSGGTTLTAVTLVNLNTGTITNNAIWSGYGAPYVYDYLGLDPAGSTNLTISGQTVIPCPAATDEAHQAGRGHPRPHHQRPSGSPRASPVGGPAA